LLDAELIDDVQALEPWREGWDELACLSRRPFCAPALVLAWWHHVRPAGARLRTVLVREDGRLVGVAPYYVERAGGLARYRALGAGAWMRVEPVAEPGREREVAAAVARALAAAHPKPDIMPFDGIPSTSPWPEAIAASWPGRRPRVHVDVVRPAPILSLRDGTFESWLAGKSRNFRQQMGRARRALEAGGATFHLAATVEEALAGLGAFASLHHARWEGKGGSGVMTPKIEAMLERAARDLAPGTRFRLWSIEAQGRTISSHLFLAAGREAAYWLGGFDEAWAKQYPSMLCILAAIEHAWSLGDERMDFGGGGQPYKYRFADGEESLQWLHLIPSGPRAPLAQMTLMPRRGYRLLSRYVSEERRARLKRLVGFGRAPSGSKND
jgi:CelD/BcsL family acetyltransferase involved in cellulose biosynthesis